MSPPMVSPESPSLSPPVQDLPLGLMDDIYEFVKNFSTRIDEVEEVSGAMCPPALPVPWGQHLTPPRTW